MLFAYNFNGGIWFSPFIPDRNAVVQIETTFVRPAKGAYAKSRAPCSASLHTCFALAENRHTLTQCSPGNVASPGFVEREAIHESCADRVCFVGGQNEGGWGSYRVGDSCLDRRMACYVWAPLLGTASLLVPKRRRLRSAGAGVPAM